MKLAEAFATFSLGSALAQSNVAQADIINKSSLS